MGCDPEFFFSLNNEILGAEKVIKNNELAVDVSSGNNNKITVDGVQGELNPIPSTCRQTLAYNISKCFNSLNDNIKNTNSLHLDFSQTVEVGEKELESLSERCRTLGCAPSQNLYSNENKIKLDASKYRTRSAGGHIHLGSIWNGTSPLSNEVKQTLTKPERIIPMLDIVLGNTCVLLDKSDLNKERRKVYGKAGEFRTPKYGIEYRTLSNFWLKSYQLMSFVMGMARLSVTIVANTFNVSPNNDCEKSILANVDIEKIRKAINNNDYELAMENFSKIKPILMENIDPTGSFSLSSANIKYFEHFLTKNLDYWFKDDPVQCWIDYFLNKDTWKVRNGWENFLIYQVKSDMESIKQDEKIKL